MITTWIKKRILNYTCNRAGLHLYEVIIACFKRNAEQVILAEA